MGPQDNRSGAADISVAEDEPCAAVPPVSGYLMGWLLNRDVSTATLRCKHLCTLVRTLSSLSAALVHKWNRSVSQESWQIRFLASSGGGDCLRHNETRSEQM